RLTHRRRRAPRAARSSRQVRRGHRAQQRRQRRARTCASQLRSRRPEVASGGLRQPGTHVDCCADDLSRGSMLVCRRPLPRPSAHRDVRRRAAGMHFRRVSGEAFDTQAWSRARRRRTRSTRTMKILILGAGQVGSTAAFSLAREEANEVTIVDRNADVLRELQDRLDVRTVVGNASHPDVLERAGARDADMLIALTSSDEINMLACQIALTLFRTPMRIARIRARALIANEALFGPGGIPVDVAISPSSLVTDYIAQLIRFPGALQVLEFADGKVRLVATRADRGGALVGHPLRDLPKHIPNVESRVVAIYRGGKGIIPDGDTVVEEGDEVFFLAARNDARTVLREMRKLDEPARKVVIAGGGNIGLDLARTLEGSCQVKIIERDFQRARRISDQLSRAIVLQGDSADEELLLEENIDSTDVFVAVTNAEEANILSAMLAKRLGARKVMALINKIAY